jgi:ubiquinone/menaquinone biosynthesis C-methylase UbiE
MEVWESVEKQLIDVKNQSWTSLLQMYGAMRTLMYVVEVLPLSVVRPSMRKKIRSLSEKDFRRLKQIIAEVWLLIQQDSERIAAGIYPTSVLQPDLSMGHWGQLLQIWIRGYRFSNQSNSNLSRRTLDLDDMEALRDIPGHYRQHFNYAGNSFLDPDAASMYEHQMELLFLGAMDAMRRLLLAPMKKAFRFSEGEGLRFLEIGCGAGRMTRFVKLAFPKAKITVLDASPAYLKEAQKNLMEFSRIDFTQGDALDLPFRDGRFDAVYSSFMLHEMSLEIRRKVLAEAYRVLADRGWLGFVDLLQYDDHRELNWTLDQPWFIGQEPFIKDYAMNSVSGALQRLGLEHVTYERGFLCKAVFGTKNLQLPSH